MASEELLEQIIFNERTTYLADYKRKRPSRNIIDRCKKESPTPPPLKGEQDPIKYIHTFCNWKCRPPFTLYHKPKPILREDPRSIQPKIEKPKDADLERVRATRPRLVISPAISLDDIADPKARQAFYNITYKTTAMEANEKSLIEDTSVKSPFPGPPACAVPLYVPTVKLDMVPEEWRMETLNWDNKQIRDYCDPTKSFWLNRKHPQC